MSSGFEQKIESIAEGMRDAGQSPNPETMLEACVGEGLEIDLDVVRLIVTRFGGSGGEAYFPSGAADFIVRLLAMRSPGSLLDPSAGAGLLAMPVYKAVRPESFEAFSANAFHAEVWKHVSNAQGIRFHHADGLAALASTNARYDAVVSCPPFGARVRNPLTVEVDGEERELRGDYAHLLMLEACRHLNPDGVAIFVVPNNFFFSAPSERIRRELAAMGFVTTAAIELPVGTFAPHTNIATHIVVMEQADGGGQLFTGRLMPDGKNQDALLTHFQNRTAGAVLEKGRMVDAESFRGFTAFELSERMVRAAERHGLIGHPFSDVVCEVNDPALPEDGGGFEDKENAVYLPRVGTGKVVASQKDLPDNPKNFFQLVTNSGQVDVEFLAGLLNTSFGRLWRESMGGGSMSIITRKALEGALLYLPKEGGGELQKEVVECQRQLDRIKTEVRELETRLWERPESARSLAKSIRAINQEDRYEDWLETLPFPLASILWSCHTQTGSSKEKYERKIHFFEALAQFLGVIHLSAFSSNEKVWESLHEPLNRALEQGNVSLRMATFGTWAIISGFFSKRGRSLLEKDSELIFELYKTRNRELLEVLFSKKLVALVQEVNKIRNDRLGHTGIVSEQDAADLDGVLNQKIQAVRGGVGLVWEDYPLLIPGDCRYVDGNFEYKAKRVVGTRTPFPKHTVTTTDAMGDGHLHLIDADGTRGLKLLPFVKVLPSPKTEENACYFYNRSDKKGIRFLSYYFEGDAEVVDEFGDVVLALRQLGTGNGLDSK